MHWHTDQLFAPLDRDLAMERIAGGNETEVYRTDDRRFVVKVKEGLGGSLQAALQEATQARAAAEEFAACLGPKHSLPSYYIIAADQHGDIQPVVIQPYIANGTPLAELDYRNLDRKTRKRLAKLLRRVIRRATKFYWQTGALPDLYGRRSADPSERSQNKSWRALPQRVWSFLIERSILRSHNLMLTNDQPAQLILIDYDTVRRNPLYRFVYFAVRMLLFFRDLAIIQEMRLGGPVPGKTRKPA
jgi:hypothetical protein